MSMFSHRCTTEKELSEFVSEMRTLAMLRHPNVLLILGVVLERERQCLVSEFCAGGSLHEWIHGHKLDTNRKLSIARETASAMEYLHGRSIIHRDLSEIFCFFFFFFCFAVLSQHI
jgi:serine/threonine protein kinase